MRNQAFSEVGMVISGDYFKDRRNKKLFSGTSVLTETVFNPWLFCFLCPTLEECHSVL